ncbi:hypothetical protein ABMA28_005436 [Loxostege sticticalis]|uniref:Uncharacterized protein n=1 Tax=Loxostege sticticalis TaxID=481309 RepID=A0ABD0SQE8_LOXSC
MFKIAVVLLMATVVVSGYVPRYKTEKFRVGIEYTKSLPMEGKSDRYRHRNNCDPFFVTLSTTAKKGYVITYLDVTVTVDAMGEIDFNVIRGQTGSRSMMFQIVSNHSDFLSFSYLAYGMREEEYRKISNVIIIGMPNHARRTTINYTFLSSIVIYFVISFLKI